MVQGYQAPKVDRLTVEKSKNLLKFFDSCGGPPVRLTGFGSSL